MHRCIVCIQFTISVEPNTCSMRERGLLSSQCIHITQATVFCYRYSTFGSLSKLEFATLNVLLCTLQYIALWIRIRIRPVLYMYCTFKVDVLAKKLWNFHTNDEAKIYTHLDHLFIVYIFSV